MSSFSNLSSLPTELLIQILSYLPYWDLKQRLPHVNSEFAAILSDVTWGKGDLQRALYRGYPKAIIPSPRNATSVDQYEYHPAFDILHYNCENDISEAEFRFPAWLGWSSKQRIMLKGNVFYGREKLIYSSMRSESAVVPAVTRLEVRIKHLELFWREVAGTGEAGAVTVWDVITAIDGDFTCLTNHAVQLRLGPRAVPISNQTMKRWLGGLEWLYIEELSMSSGGLLQLLIRFGGK